MSPRQYVVIVKVKKNIFFKSKNSGARTSTIAINMTQRC